MIGPPVMEFDAATFWFVKGLEQKQCGQHCSFKPKSGALSTRYAGQFVSSVWFLLTPELAVHIESTHGFGQEDYDYFLRTIEV